MAIHAHDITFSYGSRFNLRVGEFRAEAGRFTGLIGANGCGKTTLLRVVSGLVRPQSGTILLDGTALPEYSSNSRARRLAFVPQSHRPTFDFTVEQTVLLGRIPHRGPGGFDSPADIEAAARAIELMELEALRRESIMRLSGGELQRVMIARALAQQTGTIVLDEPNSHLDIGHQLRVLEILKRIAVTEGIAIVASVHDLNLAAIFADTVYVMAQGRVLASGEPRTALRQDTLSTAFAADLVIEPDVYGNAPLVRYRHRPDQGGRNG